MMERLCVDIVERRSRLQRGGRSILERQWTMGVDNRHNGTVSVVLCVANLCTDLFTDYLYGRQAHAFMQLFLPLVQ